MPYKITWETGGVLWSFHGTLTGEDALQANLDIYGDPRFDDLFYQIVDISGVERFAASSEDLEAAAAMDDAATISNPRLVVAVVAATSEAVQVAEAYAAAMTTSCWKIRVFCSMEEARQWVRRSHGIAGKGSGEPDGDHGRQQ